MSEHVRALPHPADQIIADVVLGLRLHAETFLLNGIPKFTVDSLYADSLGRRRSTLLAQWHYLHTALGYPKSTDPPSDRTLRGTAEPYVLRELARRLLDDGVLDPDRRSPLSTTPASGDRLRSKGRIVVVGGAAMEATFRTKAMPASETFSEAYGFDMSPGGKGVYQAVAAARLGLDVSLVAAVADDRFGQEIVHYLRGEGVDTSYLKMVRHARTPFSGIFEMELGDSIGVNWRNDAELRLEVRDVDQLRHELTECDAVLVTFEIPQTTMQRTLALAHDEEEETHPLLIVTPSPPYSGDYVSRQSLSHIDYMVAHNWELGRYSTDLQRRFDPDPIAQNLLAAGVENICLLGNGGCTIYTNTELETFSVPSFPSIYKESSVARDVFAAALAAQLIDNNQTFSEQVAMWATAAASCATSDFPLSTSLPDRRRVDSLLSRSRFTVKPASPQ